MTTMTVLEACLWVTVGASFVGLPACAYTLWDMRRKAKQPPPPPVDAEALRRVAAELQRLSETVDAMAAVKAGDPEPVGAGA